jgi:hypothetical protein
MIPTIFLSRGSKMHAAHRAPQISVLFPNPWIIVESLVQA